MLSIPIGVLRIIKGTEYPSMVTFAIPAYYGHLVDLVYYTLLFSFRMMTREGMLLI